MTNALKSKIKLLVVVAIVGVFVWTFILSPMLTFKANEKRLEDAAKRYYELNSNLLPTGERVGTVTLETLYRKAYFDKDLFIPLTKKTCSVTNSWVKVKRVNGEYKYFTYLECGVMTSSVDHKGPVVKLNGDSEITIGVGEKYEDPGIKSVVDNKDGKIDVKDVTIKGKVDTSKVGTFEIKYTARDSMNNTTTVVRTVEVVQKFNSLVKKGTGDDKDYYTGAVSNNYVYFSNMLFRIVGMDGNNVKIVADKDIANVNYDGIDEWLKYYESNLTENAKKYIIPTKYCESSGNLDLKNFKCNSYTKKKNVGILSIDEVNRVYGEENANYLVNNTISWTSHVSEDKKTVMIYSGNIYSEKYNLNFSYFKSNYNLGVRPVMVIDGNILVSDGDGSRKKPYMLEDYIKPVNHVKVNERYVGEYIDYGGIIWRISKIESDGTVRIISNQGLNNESDFYFIDYQTTSKQKIYNPKQKGNIGYIINNRSSEIVDTDYLVNHEIEVPIYKNIPAYGKEVSTKKYEVKFSAPNMYEMFSASHDRVSVGPYWLINSSKNDNLKLGVTDSGTVIYDEFGLVTEFGIRPVAYLNKNCTIISGYGTEYKPFKITK